MLLPLGTAVCNADLRVPYSLQVGVMGWSTSSTAVTAASVGKVKFKQELPAVKACLKQLQQQHDDLDYIIGLSHAGKDCTCPWHHIRQ